METRTEDRTPDRLDDSIAWGLKESSVDLADRLAMGELRPLFFAFLDSAMDSESWKLDRESPEAQGLLRIEPI